MLTFGGMCRLPQSRGGACFCTRGAMQDCDGYYFILALAKTVTPVGVPGGSRGGPWRQPQNRLFSYSIVATRIGNCIYRFVSCWAIYLLIIYYLNIEINLIFRVKLISENYFTVISMINS